jgi:hypothetical protein
VSDIAVLSNSKGRAAASIRRPLSLLVDPARLLRFHLVLAQRLRERGFEVTFVRRRAEVAAPSSVELLLELERLIYRRRNSLTEKIDASALEFGEAASLRNDAVEIDLCGSAESELPENAWRLLFDGAPGEAALLAALLHGRAPVIELVDARSRVALERATPGIDASSSIVDQVDSVLARVVTTIVAAVSRPAPQQNDAPGRSGAGRGLLAPRLAAAQMRSLAWAVGRRLRQLCVHDWHWRVYWRLVDGRDVWDTHAIADVAWNGIPDDGLRFYADPFPIAYRDKLFVFMEEFDYRAGKAVISAQQIEGDALRGSPQVVLEEPWHLSYPMVFEHGGQVWMIPESAGNKSVTLYRADPFPSRWVPEATLLSDVEASDATLCVHAGKFWMFVATRDGAGSWSDTLSIFHADRLLGPWRPHALNPIVIHPAQARPAGAFVARHGKLWRPVQDCTSGYGTGINLAEVVRLDEHAFEQRIVSRLRAPAAWPDARFHTLNRAGRLECIDGAGRSPLRRPAWLRGR